MPGRVDCQRTRLEQGGEAEKRRGSFPPCKSLGERARRKGGREARMYDGGCRGQGAREEEEEEEEAEAAEGPDSGARAQAAPEQAWTWGSSSPELGTKEQGCSFWLAMTNDSFSRCCLLTDDCMRVQAYMNNCRLNGWGMRRAGGKKTLWKWCHEPVWHL